MEKVNFDKLEKNVSWDAAEFFRNLTAHNRLAQEKGYSFAEVSDLLGLEEYIDQMQKVKAAVCLSEISPGYTALNNTPHTRRVKTVFLIKRHAIDDMKARRQCMEELRELYRQFMSAIFKQRTMLREGLVYFDDRVQFTEIDKYFAAGCACAYFQVAYDVFTNIVYRPEEWL